MKCNDSDHRVIACYLESYEEYAVEGLKVEIPKHGGYLQECIHYRYVPKAVTRPYTIEM